MNETPLCLVGTHEVCILLGVSRQRVYQLAARPDFPPPVARLAQGKIWDRAAIDEWIRTHRTPRKAGRKPITSAGVETMRDDRIPHQRP